MGPIVYIQFYEFLLLPIYLFLIFRFVQFIAKKYYKYSLLTRFLYIGVAAKLFGSIFFALMAQYFFKEGDTFMYFSGGLEFKKFLFDNFPKNINLIFDSADNYGKFYNSNSENLLNYGYMSGTANVFTAKVSGLISIFTFNGYLLTSLFFGLIAFTGMWRLFVLFSSIYPKLTKQCGWCFIFLPSILYWGGGIMKDTLCLGAIGWLFSSFYYFFILHRKHFSYIFFMAISIILLANVKDYIAVSICFILLIWLVIILVNAIKNNIARKAMIGFICLCLVSFLVIFSSQIMELLNDQLFIIISNTVTEAAKGYSLVNGDGAGLSNISDVQPNFGSIVSKIPIAITNALFRPFIWEAPKLNVMMSALENFAILFFTVFVFIKKGIFSTIRKIFSTQIILICFSFSILFAILIGLTCFNYGSLVRYKLPCIPFYCFTLVLLYYNDVKKTVTV